MRSAAPRCSRSSKVCSTTAPQTSAVCRRARDDSGSARRKPAAPIERLGAVDGFQFDELALGLRAVFQRIGHRPHRDGFGDASARPRKASSPASASRWTRCTATSPPSSMRPSSARPVSSAVRERSHAGDRRHAQHEAGEKNAKARKAAAHLAPRQPEGEGRNWFTRWRSSATMAPSFSRTMRRQRRASASSCVTRNRVVPSRACSAKSRSATLAGMAVEIAGGFVGEENFRARRHGAGKRHALLFAAGQLARIMLEAGAEADRFEFARAPVRRHPSGPAARAAPRHSPAPSWSG